MHKMRNPDFVFDCNPLPLDGTSLLASDMGS